MLTFVVKLTEYYVASALRKLYGERALSLPEDALMYITISKKIHGCLVARGGPDDGALDYIAITDGRILKSGKSVVAEAMFLFALPHHKNVTAPLLPTILTRFLTGTQGQTGKKGHKQHHSYSKW